MPRVTFRQLNFIAEFMEKHPDLARGSLDTTPQGRHEAKTLWRQLTNILNSMDGEYKSSQGWTKYWLTKKSSLKSVMKVEGKAESKSTSSGFSSTDKRFLKLLGYKVNTPGSTKQKSVKDEPSNSESEESKESAEDKDDEDEKPIKQLQIEFVNQPVADRQTSRIAVMDKLLTTMGDQATALAQLAQSSLTQAQAMDRLADSSQVQANALQQVANCFERIGGSLVESRNSLMNIDRSVQRCMSATLDAHNNVDTKFQ